MTVSFIIINYNTPELTCKCVKSIQEHVGNINREIIVVDNCSKKELFQRLKGLCPQEVTILRNTINTGFGLGNNLGAQQAKGDYLGFVNSDVELYQDCVSPICQYLDEHPQIGSACPQQYKALSSPVPSFKHDIGIRHELFGDGIFEKYLPHKFPRRKDFSQTAPFSVPQISGSFMIFPRKLFWEAGGFDPNIFLYYEEYDMGKRILSMGFKNMVFPQFGYLHLHEASTSSGKKAAYRELHISKIYVYEKFHGIFLSSIFRAICLLKLCFKPAKWYILPVFLKGNTLAYSLRYRQKGILQDSTPQNK